ncbi:MAG: hypothetical protein JWQ89_2236 [Devosia sp.]|nr:hypothetical protein [Devosia sp.]
MFFRIVTGIKTHFESRVTEWFMGLTLTNYGLGLVGANDAWANVTAWQGMTQYLPENAWGWLCIAAGLARLLALAVNGTFADTAYSKYSPHVRGITAIASAAFWFMVLLSVSAVATAGNRIYPLPLALELWCIFHAWRDTGRAKAASDGMAH